MSWPRLGWGRRPRGAGEKLLEDAVHAGAAGSESGALSAAEIEAAEIESCSRLALSAGLSKLVGVFPALSELVVFFAFFGVGKHLVRLVDFLEFLFGGLVARIYVRVVLAGQLAVSLLDVLVAGAAAESENVVIVFCCHRISCAWIAVL